MMGMGKMRAGLCVCAHRRVCGCVRGCGGVYCARGPVSGRVGSKAGWLTVDGEGACTSSISVGGSSEQALTPTHKAAALTGSSVLRQRVASPLVRVSMPLPGATGYGQDSPQPLPRARQTCNVRVPGTFSSKLAFSMGQG